MIYIFNVYNVEYKCNFDELKCTQFKLISVMYKNLQLQI